MVGAQGLLLALSALIELNAGAVLRSKHTTLIQPPPGTTTSTTTSGLMIKRHDYHYEILVNRFPDFHCEHKSLEDNEYHDSIGADVKIGDFHGGAAQSKCSSLDSGKPFHSVIFNWEAHMFGSEELDMFGQCRLFAYADTGCEDALHIMDWANAVHNLQKCYPLRAKDGKEVVALRLECRRGDASW